MGRDVFGGVFAVLFISSCSPGNSAKLKMCLLGALYTSFSFEL